MSETQGLLDGKIALITGTGQGNGRALALGFTAKARRLPPGRQRMSG